MHFLQELLEIIRSCQAFTVGNPENFTLSETISTTSNLSFHETEDKSAYVSSSPTK